GPKRRRSGRQGEAILASDAGSLLAAARSSSHRVRLRPVAPAAGIWGDPAPPRAMRTAPAFSSPAVTSHTSRAALMAANDSDRRVGGGFGAPRTGITIRSSYSAGAPGNNDATCPSGPTPSSKTSKDGTGAWSPGRDALARASAYDAAAASTSSP